jgi:hypothetical protein
VSSLLLFCEIVSSLKLRQLIAHTSDNCFFLRVHLTIVDFQFRASENPRSKPAVLVNPSSSARFAMIGWKRWFAYSSH